MGENVYLFIPNLVDYGRVLSLLISLLTFNHYPIPTIIFYAMSQLLDCLDGFAARYYHQESQFGAVLDMVTDRFSSAAFALCLSHLFPEYMIGFSLFIILDFGSHWIQMYATLLSGEKHHKKQKTNSKLMKIYYESRMVLFWFCFGSEMFLVNLYIYAKADQLGMGEIAIMINKALLYLVALPVFALKQFISIVCLISSVEKIVEIDLKKRNSEKTN